MCFFSPPKPQPTNTTAPPLPAAPIRADEENRRVVDDQLDLIRRRQGRGATAMTGGLGDPGFGGRVSAPRAGGTSLGL